MAMLRRVQSMAQNLSGVTRSLATGSRPSALTLPQPERCGQGAAGSGHERATGYVILTVGVMPSPSVAVD